MVDQDADWGRIVRVSAHIDLGVQGIAPPAFRVEFCLIVNVPVPPVSAVHGGFVRLPGIPSLGPTSNNTIFAGAIVGYTVTLGQKSHLTYEADTSSLLSGALQRYYRTSFQQCPALSSTGDPTSGC